MRNVPELPPGYAYDRAYSRVYITYPADGMRRHIYYPNTTKHRYWNREELAALFAWKHAYMCLKEEKSRVS